MKPTAPITINTGVISPARPQPKGARADKPLSARSSSQPSSAPSSSALPPVTARGPSAQAAANAAGVGDDLL
jgi:hypothetical protein